MPSFYPCLCSLGPRHLQKEVRSSHKLKAKGCHHHHHPPPFLPIIAIPGTHSGSTVCQTLCATGVRAKPLQSCLALCNPMGWKPLGFSVCGILQIRILEWAAVPASRGSSQPRVRTWVSCTGRWVLYHQRHLESPGFNRHCSLPT